VERAQGQQRRPETLRLLILVVPDLLKAAQNVKLPSVHVAPYRVKAKGSSNSPNPQAHPPTFPA